MSFNKQVTEHARLIAEHTGAPQDYIAADLFAAVRWLRHTNQLDQAHLDQEADVIRSVWRIRAATVTARAMDAKRTLLEEATNTP